MIALALYLFGFGLTYSLIPASFPISLAGQLNWKRWTIAILWPVAGFILLGACFATMFK